MEEETSTRTGGRRRMLTAMATGCATLAGTVLVGVGLIGSNGPPQPPPGKAGGAIARPIASESSAGSRHEEASWPSPPASLARSVPTVLDIPAIGVHTSKITEVGLTTDRRLEVPPVNETRTVGWYQKGPAPGQIGPAVLVGHVDSDTGPSIFFELGDLRPGDKIKVTRADGKTAVFTIYAVASYPKVNFLTHTVYGDTTRPELRLITCGGTFNEATQHYRSNIVVNAYLTGIHTH